MVEAPVPSPQPHPSKIERRAAVRYSCRLEASCQAVPAAEQDENWPARVRDISTNGVGLVVARCFEPGTLLGLELQSEDESLAYTLMTQVVRTVDVGGDFWLLGCEFARPLSEEELHRLL